MKEIIINPIRIAYTTEDGKERAEEIAKTFRKIIINQGGKIMDEGMNAMREQPSVTRINDLLEEVDKEIHGVDSGICEINKRLLPSIPPPKDTESKDLAKDLKVEIKMPHQELGWFIQTIVKLERLRNHLREISDKKVQELKRATGLLEPDSKDLRERKNGSQE